MFKKKELTRLGDILVSKGLISKAQLDLAIQEQSRRKRLLDPSDATAKVTPIGEILIELGFIDQLQLKRGLNWQQRLRHVSIAMALCAPFVMFAPSIARAAPTTIEAENYSTMSGVIKENTSDVGGGQQLGDINTGDWVNYNNIDVPATGTYKITYRVSSYNGGAVISLRNAANASIGPSVTIPKTGSWSNWIEVEQTVTLQQGVQSLKIFAEVGGFNLNWFKLENVTPFNQTIEGESYSKMSGVITEATADVGGGKNVGDINTGDWMVYSGINIPVTDTYKITYRVSSYNGNAVIALRDAAEVELGAVTVPKTGSWNNWIEVEHIVTLKQGLQDLKLFAKVGGVNLNWFKIERVSTLAPVVVPPPPPPPATTVFPLTVQAENYTTGSGVIKEATADVGGGQNVGDINTGDWMSYADINVPETEEYKIIYRVSSYNGGAVIALKGNADAVLGTVTIPKTGSWSNWIDVEQKVILPKGVQNLKVFAQVGGFNLNWFRIERAAPPPISVLIQSESYSSMTGVISETTTDVDGGKNVGAISTGDTMTYANTPVTVPVTGKYKISYRLASPNTSGSIVLNDLNSGTIVDALPVPKTGGWQKWVTVEREVTLTKGEYKFSMLAKVGGFNINWFKIETATASVSSSSAAPVQSSSSSSAPAVSSSSSSSAPAVSSSSSSAPATNSSSSWSSASSVGSTVSGPVGISWTAPAKRENGVDLYIDEVGGYEIRYKKITDTKYTYITINDAYQNRYDFDYLSGDYVFQIAAFDKNGVYSPFVDIKRQ